MLGAHGRERSERGGDDPFERVEPRRRILVPHDIGDPVVEKPDRFDRPGEQLRGCNRLECADELVRRDVEMVERSHELDGRRPERIRRKNSRRAFRRRSAFLLIVRIIGLESENTMWPPCVRDA